jgi:hypothetical protein
VHAEISAATEFNREACSMSNKDLTWCTLGCPTGTSD